MKYLVYILFLFVVSSCSKVIDMDIDNKSPKLVINAWLRPDSIVKVHLSKSMHILENGENPVLIENAQVNLFENNIKIETLHYTSDGYYASDNFFPKAGNTYKIEAFSQEMGTAITESVLPDTIQINSIKTEYSSGDSKQKITVNFKDNGNKTNYYMVYMEREKADTFKKDEYYYNSKIWYSTNSPYVELAGDFSLLGDFYAVENEMGISDNNELSASAIAFSDNLFNGSSAKIELEFYSYDPNVPYYKEAQNTQNVMINFVSISKDYFKYISSFHGGEANPFTEREQTFCNVKNGFGILLSSNHNKRVVNFSGK